MVNYYEIYRGDLYPGHVAKSSDIMMNFQLIQDAIASVSRDLTEGQSWILGTNDGSDQYSFILTPEAKRAGRYIDQMNLAEGDDMGMVSIRETSYRQPIKLTRSSLYSVIVKMQNKSEVSVPVVFELHDDSGHLIPNMKTVLTLPKNTDAPKEFEIVFDLDYYPTAHGIEPTDAEQGDYSFVIQNTDEESYENGIDYGDNEDLNSSSAGVSQIYLCVEALNKNKQKAFDVNTEQNDGYKWNDTDPTFGLVINKNSTYGQLLEENTGSEYVTSSTKGDLYFKEIYANSPTYKCEIGQAIINGEKVMLADTHISIGGASSEGNVVSYIYMDTEGHLKAKSSDPFMGDEAAEPILVTEPHLHIANITTYMNDVNDPIIEQSDETQITRPRSHHERIRRLEKQEEYTQDIAIPPRFKYTLTGKDWVDPKPNVDMVTISYDGLKAQSIDALNEEGYIVTTDKNGNFIVKVSESESFSIPITLKSETSGKVTTDKNKTKIISSAQTTSYINDLEKDNIKRAQTFAEIKNMENDVSNGTLTLKDTDSGIIVATNKKEAQKTEFNPWDDAAANRPATSNVKPITRQYTITSGKNGANDWASEFPAMTFYTNTGYKLKKLQIPIYKFKNCSSIKFIIWKRQGPNNKKNTVWFEKKIYTSKSFSLKNAKTKKGYQYMEDGFLIDFGKNGLTLPKGQYVIVCLPTASSNQGTVYVDTYKPKDSQDFCIRYYGAANASHFLLKERYQEIWYNPVKAQAEEISYSTSGSIVSGVVSWTNKETIKSVKPIANLTTPSGTSAKIYVDIGGGWTEVENKKSKNLTGSGSGESFRWKIEFKGNSKATPTLKYDKNKKYAINFEITRAEPSTSKLSAARSIDNNICLTSKMFDANNILREYIGDMNFALNDNKFSNYEFVRFWGTDADDEPTLIDISASDRLEPIKNSSGEYVKVNGVQTYYPVYSFHYVDLKMSDLPNTSVDYSNYDPLLEEDEHNLRMKLDTNHSYNDDDIKVISYKNFELTNEAYKVPENTKYIDENDEESEDGLFVDLTKIVASDQNQIIAKAKLNNKLDLTQYSGLKLGIALNGTTGGSISGLALYISSQNEVDPPTNVSSDDILSALEDGLPDLNNSQQNIIDKYANQIIKDVINNNGTAETVYYKSVWDSATQKWEWQQLHDVKSYNIYEIIDRSTKKDQLTITEANNNHKQFYEIDIDTNSVNLQYATEIGLIILSDENKYHRDNVTTLALTDFKAIKKGYYSVFNASEKNTFKSNMDISRETDVICKENGQLNIQPSNSVTWNSTTPPTSRIKIIHQNINSAGEDLCSFDLTSKSTKGFNHIGIQLASDCLLTKNMLELHLRKIDEDNNETTIEKIRIPTINYIYYSTNGDNKINLVQIVKKIKTTEKFDKIVLHATNKFRNYAGQLKNVTSSNTAGTLGADISIYIGNIVLYEAESFPLLYPMMRMKFYLDEANSSDLDNIGIRKVGAVIQYQ